LEPLRVKNKVIDIGVGKKYLTRYKPAYKALKLITVYAGRKATVIL
jgi:hypothetical protein